MGIDSVLVAFRSEDVIEDAINALQPLGGLIVVVDHGDGTSARTASSLGAVTHEDPTNPGFGSGQNRGVATTSSEFVLLCNPDATVDPAAIRQGSAYLAARPEVAAVEGVIVNTRTGQPERSQGVEIGPLHLLGRAAGARVLLQFRVTRALARRVPALCDHAQRVPEEPIEVESLAATALLMRRSAYDAVEGFDESYFLYGEDLDLCRRLRMGGWKLLSVPGLWANHESGGSAASSWDRELSWWCGTMHFAARWWDPVPWALAVLAATTRWIRLSVRRPSRTGEALELVLLRCLRERKSLHHPWFLRWLSPRA